MKIASLSLYLVLSCILLAQSPTNVLPQNLRFGQTSNSVNKILNIETPKIREMPIGHIPEWCWLGIENWELVESDNFKYYNFGFNNGKLARIITYYYDPNSLMKSLSVLKNKLNIIKLAESNNSVVYAGSTKNVIVYSAGIWGQQISDGFIAYFDLNDPDIKTIDNMNGIKSSISKAKNDKKDQIKKDMVNY